MLRMGGAISAEHGIGVLKRDELPDVKDKVAIELMRGIKAMLEPQGIRNPGMVRERLMGRRRACAASNHESSGAAHPSRRG